MLWVDLTHACMSLLSIHAEHMLHACRHACKHLLLYILAIKFNNESSSGVLDQYLLQLLSNKAKNAGASSHKVSPSRVTNCLSLI